MSLDSILAIAVPIAIICAAAGLLYAKVSYVRQFVAWIFGKMTEKKEEVRERLNRSEYTQLAFRYGD